MPSIKILPHARPIIAPLENTATPEAKKVIDQAIGELVGVDGNRVLDEVEAQALRGAYDDIIGTQTGPITLQQAEAIKTAVGARIDQMKAEQVKATDVIFTSEGEALTRFRERIMGQIHSTIDKANGRPVDVNMMLFSFTDKVMADEILDIARTHPHVTFRLLTDWTQLASSGSRQPPRLAKIADDDGLTNVQVKFKNDNPYIWSSSAGRPVFSHGHTKGLNHHKGFVTLIDGRPETMAFGSFNWSVSAMKSNYENLMLLDRKDPDNRPVMKGYEKEFESFWNDDDMALMYNEARQRKNELYQALYDEHNVPYTPFDAPTGPNFDDVQYVAEDVNGAYDINSFHSQDVDQVVALLGKTRANKIFRELRDYGRFNSFTELLARVPDVAKAPTWKLEQLRENVEFGVGGLSINSATVEELDRAGLSKSQAQKVVALREQKGAFESLDELDDIPGIGKGTIDRIRGTMTDDQVIGLYSARKLGGDARTGWSDDHQGTINVPTAGNPDAVDTDLDADGKVIAANRDQMEAIDRDLSAAVVDLCRRAKRGDTLRLAMYGLSTSSPEYKALEEAAARGIKVRVVIYKSYNGTAIDALKQLKQDGFDVDTRVIKSRVMHEKFGVVGDDVFNGSANMSSSSITKHSEDRFLFRNDPDLRNRFVEEFARLWDKGYEPVD
jgi:competence ComEA-like helix-hairpin-helix protein